MREAARSHCLGVFLADPILIARDERYGDAGLVARKPGANMPGKAQPDGFEPAASTWLHNFNRSKRLPDRSNALEPGIAREVVSAREGHWRRRREPGAHPDDGPG